MNFAPQWLVSKARKLDLTLGSVDALQIQEF